MIKFLFLYLIAISLFASVSKAEKLDVLLTRGLNAFENGKCLNNDGAIRYFEDFINAGGDKFKVLKYLAYCKIKVGQNKAGEEETLKEGIKFLAQLFENNNQDTEVLKLLISLYIQTQNYEKAKDYAILISDEKNIDNDLYLLLARLYFNTKEYHKSINYLNKYKADNEYKNEKLFMLGVLYFKLGKDNLSKKHFNNLLKEKNVDKDYKDIAQKILEIIKSNENYGKYPSWYSFSLINGLVFDSNIISQPPFSSDFNPDDYIGVPALDDLDDDEYSAMGARDENYITFNFYPLNLSKHTIFAGFNNLIALHYPKSVEDVFDPQEYDTLGLSGNLGYEYHNYFTRNNVFKFLITVGYERNWTNPLNNISLYNKEIKSALNLFYRFENSVEFGWYSSFRIDDFNDDDGEDNPSQDGKYFDSLIYTTLPVTAYFSIYLQTGYIGSKTVSDVFSYNGFSGKGGISFYPLKFLSLSANIKYEHKAYKDTSRKDDVMALGSNLNISVTDGFDISLTYFFNKNDSTLDGYSFDKHLIGVYFSFFN